MTIYNFYVYNRDAFDDIPCGLSHNTGYGWNPPAQAITFLNQTLSKSIYTINSASDPKGDKVNTSPLGYYRLLSGYWSNGTPLTAGGDGYNPNNTFATPTSYVFPSNPNSSSGWSMVSESLSGFDQQLIRFKVFILFRVKHQNHCK